MRSPSRSTSALLAAVTVALGCGGAPSATSSAPPRGEAGPSAVPEKQRVSSQLSAAGIRFDAGTEALAPSAGEALDRLAAEIGRGEHGATLHVRVKVDPDPRACEGASLAEARARAIEAALVERGVPRHRVKAIGEGARPADCKGVSASRASVALELED